MVKISKWHLPVGLLYKQRIYEKYDSKQRLVEG